MKKIYYLFIILLIARVCYADPIQIQADSFEMDNIENKVIASGNIIVKQKDVVLRSKKAKYDQKQQIVFLYDHVILEKELFYLTCEEAVAYGKKDLIEVNKDIKFKYKTFHGEAQKASFFVKDQRIELNHNPKVFQRENTLTGSSIFVDLKREKVSTVGNAKINILTE